MIEMPRFKEGDMLVARITLSNYKIAEGIVYRAGLVFFEDGIYRVNCAAIYTSVPEQCFNLATPEEETISTHRLAEIYARGHYDCNPYLDACGMQKATPEEVETICNKLHMEYINLTARLLDITEIEEKEDLERAKSKIKEAFNILCWD